MSSSLSLLSSVFLQFPLMRKPFELITNAPDSSVGFVLSQRDELGRDRPVFLLQKHLVRVNWTGTRTRDKETFAFVFAQRKCCYYLLENRFIWHTDHEGLRCLRNTRPSRKMCSLNSRVWRIWFWSQIQAGTDWETPMQMHFPVCK